MRKGSLLFASKITQNIAIRVFFSRYSLANSMNNWAFKGTGHVWWLAETSILTWCIPTYANKYQTSENVDSIGHRSCDKIMKERKTPFNIQRICVLSDAVKGLQVWSLLTLIWVRNNLFLKNYTLIQKEPFPTVFCFIENMTDKYSKWFGVKRTSICIFILHRIEFNILVEKSRLSRKLRYFRGSRFSQCCILSAALHCLLPSRCLC